MGARFPPPDGSSRISYHFFMPRWREVCQALGLEPPREDAVLDEVTDWTEDAGPGVLLVLRKGTRHDPKALAGEALRRGVSAVLSEEPLDLPVPHATLPLKDEHLNILRTMFYPELRDLVLIGVTGTNGKTTTTFLLHHILSRAGWKGSLLGTLAYRLPGETLRASHTTPPPLRLARLLASTVRQGGHFAVMEVSSHALDQGRTRGLAFTQGIFLNLTREHLDYHRTLKRYALAKARLFAQSETSLIRLGPWSDLMIRHARGRVVRLGQDGDYRARIVRRTPGGLGISVNGHRFFLPLLGDHNRDNLLAAVASAREIGLPWEVLEEAVPSFPGVPGRMEMFTGPEGRVAVVDYAHTPDGIRKALESLRKHFPVVWIVFGAGGEKDRGKRPQMGRVAERLADRVILTLDNPRNEEPAQIFQDILSGMTCPARVIQDREEAVRQALSEVPPGGCVLIAGKGHEDYQEIQGVRYPYRDQDVVLAAGYSRIHPAGGPKR